MSRLASRKDYRGSSLESLQVFVAPGWPERGSFVSRDFAAESEVAASAGDVAADLVAQRFGRGKALLGAEAAQESQAEGCVFGEFDGVEVEQVGLDGEGIRAEGGAVADVGDAGEDFGGCAGADGECGDIDAVGRQQFGIAGQIDGGDGVFAAVSAAGCGRAVDGEGAAQ